MHETIVPVGHVSRTAETKRVRAGLLDRDSRALLVLQKWEVGIEQATRSACAGTVEQRAGRQACVYVMACRNNSNVRDLACCSSPDHGGARGDCTGIDGDGRWTEKGTWQADTRSKHREGGRARPTSPSELLPSSFLLVPSCFPSFPPPPIYISHYSLLSNQ